MRQMRGMDAAEVKLRPKPMQRNREFILAPSLSILTDPYSPGGVSMMP